MSGKNVSFELNKHKQWRANSQVLHAMRFILPVVIFLFLFSGNYFDWKRSEDLRKRLTNEQSLNIAEQISSHIIATLQERVNDLAFLADEWQKNEEEVQKKNFIRSASRIIIAEPEIYFINYVDENNILKVTVPENRTSIPIKNKSISLISENNITPGDYARQTGKPYLSSPKTLSNGKTGVVMSYPIITPGDPDIPTLSGVIEIEKLIRSMISTSLPKGYTIQVKVADEVVYSFFSQLTTQTTPEMEESAGRIDFEALGQNWHVDVVPSPDSDFAKMPGENNRQFLINTTASFIASLALAILMVLVEKLFHGKLQLELFENRYRIVFENTLDGLAVISRDGEILDANSKVRKNLKLVDGELKNIKIHQVLPHIDQERIQTFLEQAFALGRSDRDSKIETDRLIPGRWLEVRNRLIEYKNDQASLVIVRDMTDLKKKEEELERSEQEKSVVLENLAEIVIFQDLEQHIIWANQATLNHTHIVDLKGKVCYQALYNRQSVCPNCPVPEVIQTGQTITRQFETPNQTNWYMSFSPVRNAAGELIGLVEAAMDISNYVRVENALRAEQQFSSSIIQTAHTVIILLDLDYNIRVFNHYTESLTGYSQEEVLGKSVFDVLLIDEEKAEIRSFLDSALNGDESYSEAETQILCKDGSQRLISWNYSILGKGNGGLEGIIAAGVDVTEKKQAEQEVQRQLQRLNALREIDRAIATPGIDISLTLNILVHQVINQLDIEAADILILENRQILEYAAVSGLVFDRLLDHKLFVGRGFAGAAVREKRIFSLADADVDNRRIGSLPRLASGHDITYYYAVPLIAKNDVKGVLEVYGSKPLQFNAQWFNYLEALAGQAAIAIDNASLLDGLQRSNVELEQSYDSTLMGWARALEMRDYETMGHSDRVTELTVRLGERMGITGSALDNLRRGALLHDIGKMGIPDQILRKEAALTEAEWSLMKLHPHYGAEMLAPIKFLAPAIDIVLHHHEKWDGSGYPDGLKGEEIPLFARIFAICDVWDALLSDRPYRQAWSRERSIVYLVEQSGVHFDPQVVNQFLKMVALMN
jgi:PAS domain S-box-containing protein/putative nucleotidyltransferase with HDIG domain